MKAKSLIVGNWKMNHGIEDSIKFVSEFRQQSLPSSHGEVVICPPFSSLYALNISLGDQEDIQLGAQNCHCEDSGAFTGEISADFLEEVGCSYVILGHSERRHVFGESDELLSKKVAKVLDKSLAIIFCVGETDEERKQDKTFEVIDHQLDLGLSKLGRDQSQDLVVAYEPVWAIGTGNTATPEQAGEVHDHIRKWLDKKFGEVTASEISILYGGSVKPNNAKSLMSQDNIDGLLVGGASLKPKDFAEIISQATYA